MSELIIHWAEWPVQSQHNISTSVAALVCHDSQFYPRLSLMPHIGCGADVLRWRREKAQEVRRLQILGLLPKPEDFKPAKNCQFPHQTLARDPDVFNRRLCSWVR